MKLPDPYVRVLASIRNTQTHITKKVIVYRDFKGIWRTNKGTPVANPRWILGWEEVS